MERQPDDAFARRWPRLDGVDLLRGLAILFVLLNHVNMRLVIGHIPYGREQYAQIAADRNPARARLQDSPISG